MVEAKAQQIRVNFIKVIKNGKFLLHQLNGFGAVPRMVASSLAGAVGQQGM
jgi:hypothetical protein